MTDLEKQELDKPVKRNTNVRWQQAKFYSLQSKEVDVQEEEDPIQYESDSGESKDEEVIQQDWEEEYDEVESDSGESDSEEEEEEEFLDDDEDMDLFDSQEQRLKKERILMAKQAAADNGDPPTREITEAERAKAEIRAMVVGVKQVDLDSEEDDIVSVNVIDDNKWTGKGSLLNSQFLNGNRECLVCNDGYVSDLDSDICSSCQHGFNFNK